MAGTSSGSEEQYRLGNFLGSLCRSGARSFSGEPQGFATLLVDRDKGRPVRKLELRARRPVARPRRYRTEAKSQGQPSPARLGLSARAGCINYVYFSEIPLPRVQS